MAIINSYDVCRHPAHVRKSIGIVFQDPGVDDRLTGRENLRIHAYLYGVPKTERKKQIDGALWLVELDERADDLVRHYSGAARPLSPTAGTPSGARRQNGIRRMSL